MSAKHRTGWILAVVAVVAVAIAGVTWATWGKRTTSNHDLIVTAEVGRQRLQEKVTLTGRLTRDEQRQVTSAASGRVGPITTKDGDTVAVGATIMELDGREAIAVNGDLAFYRPLDVGDRGTDVRQLNQILTNGGFDPGPVGDLYTAQTRAALGRFQAAHNYPAAATAKTQTLTMALTPGNGYKNGPKSAASVVVPGSASKSSSGFTAAGVGSGIGAAFARNSSVNRLLATVVQPTITIGTSQSVVAGDTATLTITASAPVTADTQIALSVSGDLAPVQDYTPFDPVVLIPNGQSSATITILTRPHTSITHDKRLVVAIAPTSSGAYTVAAVATAVVTVLGQTGSAALPTISLSSSTALLAKGQPFIVTLNLSQATTERIVAHFSYGGSAVPGTDFVMPQTDIVVPPGQTSAQVQIPTVVDDLVRDHKTLTVTIGPDAAYTVGAASSVSTVIESANVPSMSVTASTRQVGQGGTVTFIITADQPPTKDTSVSYQITGTAIPGTDYEAVPGTVVWAAGQSSLRVVVNTIRHDVVFKPGDLIAAAWPMRVGQVLVKQDQVIAAGTPLLSLTDSGFTVKLSATASDRTKLKVGQNVTVKLAGGTNEVPGTISQLDDTVLIDAKTGAQTYGGKVNVGDPGSLGAADGATVTIDVVINQRESVLAVPIAAVKQDGTGKDVVRVIDLGATGKITEVAVVTGITEGSFIEIVSGLNGGEVVVVETSAEASVGGSPSPAKP